MSKPKRKPKRKLKFKVGQVVCMGGNGRYFRIVSGPSWDEAGIFYEVSNCTFGGRTTYMQDEADLRPLTAREKGKP